MELCKAPSEPVATETLPSNPSALSKPDVALADGRYDLSGLAGNKTRRMWTTLLLTRGSSGWRIAAIRNMLPAAPVPSKPLPENH